MNVLGLIIHQHPYTGMSKWISTPGVFQCRPKMGQSLKKSRACCADAAIHPVFLFNLSFEKTTAVTVFYDTKKGMNTYMLMAAQTIIISV